MRCCLKADYKNPEITPDELILYYPISPSIAVTINDENNVNTLNISSTKVTELNDALFKASNHEIHANSKDILEQIRNSLIAE